MPRTIRIGIQIAHDEPFWVQVREVLWQRAQTIAAELIEIAAEESRLLSSDVQAEVLDDLIVQELDAFICNIYPPALLTRILESGIPIIYVAEISLRHPHFTSRLGLYDTGYMLGAFLHERLAGSGNVLIVGGYTDDGEDNGQSRLDGFFAALPSDHCYVTHHVRTRWSQEDAAHALNTYLSEHADLHVNAIFGLSDTIAMIARDICESLGRIDSSPLILGINGDPLILAALANDRMTATVEADIDDLASQVLKLAYQAAQGEPLPPYFRVRQRLATAENVAEVATRKLLSLASLPSRLVELNRRNTRERITQRETSTAIDRKVGLILDERQLSLAITALIRDTYRFDAARFLVWQHHKARLIEVGKGQPEGEGIAPAGPQAHALTHDQTVFIPDTYRSLRFAPDPLRPEMHTRVVVPVHLGGQIIGLLDLHRREVTHYTCTELDGLELLADRLGISIRNAELYGEALDARGIAEKADRLKTVLLTNVGHELRTPLHVILGYSRTIRNTLDNPGVGDDTELSRHTAQIHGNAEHLLRLINDLLDLSRAEIGELDLLPETLNTRSFLEAVFEASTMHFGADGTVAWRLDLPPELPLLKVDPVRLRQVLLNLLHNAHKFTEYGEITLGANVTPLELHLWVADTGTGIPGDQQGQIFEPFFRDDTGAQRREGIGLGLSIARRLVALHGGRMALESQPGRGSTFHIYLPLLSQHIQLSEPGSGHPAIVLITESSIPPISLAELATQRGLSLHMLRPGDDLTVSPDAIQPALLVWDLATELEQAWKSIERIRARAQLSHVPVMLYQSGQESPFQSLGAATSLLLKPLGERVMIEALEQLAPRGAEGSILIVEDDLQLRGLHCQLIAKHFPGYTIHDAGTGSSALDIIAREIPSLIVLDLVMPEIDGFAVLEALRADSRTATLPVLVLSGKALSSDDIRRLANARVIYQTKDILAESELAEALRRTLSREYLLPPHTSALVKQAVGYIQQHYDEPINLQEIADSLSVNRHYLGRIFQQELGLSPWQYLIRYRVLRAKVLLRTTSYTIAQVAAHVGFDTATYFSHIFHREVGCSPRAFRDQTPDEAT